MSRSDAPVPGDLLARRADRTPGATALVDAATGRDWTFAALDAAVGTLCGRLSAAGVGPDDRLAMLVEPRPAAYRLSFAAARLGAVLVPLSPRWPAARLDAALDGVDPALLVCGDGTASLAAELSPDGVGATAGAGRRRACARSIDDGTAAVGPLPGPDAGPDPGPDSTAGSDAGRTGRAPDDDQWHVFTSGTTGDPKRVRLTAGNLRASAMASGLRLGVAPADRWYVPIAPWHVGGLMPAVRASLAGSTVVLAREFDAASAIAELDASDCTGASVVPTMLRRLLAVDETGGEDSPGAPAALSSLRRLLVGGAAAPPALVERALAAGVPVCPTYGLTEAASQVATATPAMAAAAPESVGPPLFDTDVTIVDPAGEPVADGEAGAIVVDGPTVTPGYADPARTAAAMGARGLHTGDRGRLVDGRLVVLGRLSERIVTGGENVDPAAVADALRAHASVADAAVVGLPDEEWGERVAALVVGGAGTAGTPPTAEELREHCRARLPAHAVPKTIAQADALPRTASGTVDREAVRRRLRDRDLE